MAQVSRWGNSLAVRIPSKVVKALDLKEGDELNVGVSEAGREFVFKRATDSDDRQAAIQQALQKLRSLPGQLPADFKFDRDDANGWDRFDKWGPDRPEREE